MLQHAGVLGRVQDNVPESYKERASRMATRLKLVAAGKPAGTALHTAALIYHESGSGSQTEEKIRLAVVVSLLIDYRWHTFVENSQSHFQDPL